MAIDYQQITESLRDEDVFRLLSELGAEPIDKGDFFLCKSVCHHDDPSEANYKLYYYKNTHIFNCYSEDGTMSIFKFLKLYYECRNIPYDWYQDILEVILKCSAREVAGAQTYKVRRGDYEAKKVRKELPSYPEGILDCFIKQYPVEWLNDSISREAMDRYNIKYSISQNKIIIPHYDATGKLVGIRGRALNQYDIDTFGKYMPVQIEGKWYSHPLSLNLYGLNWNKENIKKYGICYIFESEKSVLQFESFSMPNCAVASCGSSVNKFQIDLLARYCQPREIVVCYDREEINGETKYFNKLYEMCKKYVNYGNMSFIYDREGLSKMKDSPSDNGEEIFNALLRERVKIQ